MVGARYTGILHDGGGEWNFKFPSSWCNVFTYSRGREYLVSGMWYLAVRGGRMLWLFFACFAPLREGIQESSQEQVARSQGSYVVGADDTGILHDGGGEYGSNVTLGWSVTLRV